MKVSPHPPHLVVFHPPSQHGLSLSFLLLLWLHSVQKCAAVLGCPVFEDAYMKPFSSGHISVELIHLELFFIYVPCDHGVTKITIRFQGQKGS